MAKRPEERIARKAQGREHARERAAHDARPGGKEFMASLAKGLAVLGAFSEQRPTMNLSEAGAAVGLSRAAARRVLLTLSGLGFVEQSGRDFVLSPKVLELGFSYLSMQPWVKRAEPLMRGLSEEFQEACSAASLHGAEAVLLARIPAPSWIMAPTLQVGTRLPAFHSSLGRIQLGFLSDDEIWRRLRATTIVARTPASIIDPSALVERVKADRVQGFSIVDEELERDLRSLAVPIVARGGGAVGAISLAANASRTTRNEMRERFLPRLREVADRVASAVV